ncbi:MAG TPA: Ig-like domain-containing protein [Gemmatimonadales bacterium]|nr:Ig-like domain-containing protein [Gemmatimonadales bacterium]
MKFNFKLSQRLSRMRLPMLLAGALVIGCKLATNGPEAGLILGIDVAPARVSLVPSQSAPLTIAVFSSKTDSAAVALAQGSLQWSTTGGTIGNNGMAGGLRYITYLAPAQPGSYLIVVTTATGWPADTARINVTSTPAPVGTVAVTPGSVSLALGDTVTLRATLTDASGAAVFGRPIDWSSSDGAVAQVLVTGFVRAIGPGTATITATSENHTGTAAVTVNQ